MFLIKKLKSNNKQLKFEECSLGLYTFVNSYSYLVLRQHKNLINKYDGIYCDGTLMMLFSRIFLNQKVSRVSFDMTSIAPLTFNFALNYSKSVYFIGSDESYINSFINVIHENYPALNISGYRNGYFKGNERETTLKKIKDLTPDIVIVGMGTPLQEQFLIDLRQLGWNGLGFTCGGFIHQTSQGLHYYPNLINKLNLRWLYRLYDEPKLIKRFLRSYFIFPFIFIYDLFQYLNSDNK